MATPAPLSAALKPSLPVDDESEARYQSALKQMTEALDQRKNRFFDPKLLAMAAGFQDPATQGMGFFASLGSAAKAYSGAETKEMEENKNIAALRLEMAQAEREMARKKKGFEFLIGAPAAPAEAAASAPSGAPAGAPATTTGAPAAAPAKAPAVTQGDKSGRGVMIGGREITPAFIAQMSYSNPELGKILEQQYKLTMDSIAVQPGGYVSKVTGEYTPFGGKATVDRFVAGDPKTNQKAMKLSLTEQDAILFDKARSTGDAETLFRIIDQYTKTPARPGGAPETASRSVGAAQTAPQTAAELQAAMEVQTEAEKAEAKIQAEGRAKRFESILTSAEDVGSRLASYKTLGGIADKPGAEKIFGIFNRPEFSAALGKLLQTGVGIPGFSVGIPEIQNIMRNIRLPQEQINDYQIAASLFAQMQLQISRLQQGQGAVSNFERELFATAGVTAEDNPGTIRKKLALLTARAEFERNVAKNLRASKLNADDFKDSDQYQKLLESYHSSLYNIVAPSERPAAAARQAAPGAGFESAQSLRDRLNSRRP
jgi:hypothetical protein